VDGTPTQLTEHVFDVALTGHPLDVEFCRPTIGGNVPRLAISFQDPNSDSVDGTVRLYEALSPLQTTLTIIMTITGRKCNSIKYLVAYRCIENHLFYVYILGEYEK
jgi:hypothetical protein